MADRVVDAIALADIDTEFTDTTPDRPVIPEIAFLNAVDANQDLRLCPFVAQPSQPAQESITFDHFIFHAYIVSKRRQPSNTQSAAAKCVWGNQLTDHNYAGCEDPLCQRCDDNSAGYIYGKSKALFEVSMQATDHPVGCSCDPCQAVAERLRRR